MSQINLRAPAKDVVIYLAALHSDLTAIKLVQYPPMPGFKQVARQPSLTFEQVLDRRLRHGGKTTLVKTLDRAEITPHRLERLLDDLPGESALAVASEVILDAGKIAHIPLLDFQCAKSRKNLNFLIAAMRRIDVNGGMILASANSYHFYGRSLLKQAEWHQFVGRCLLLDPLVDVRYLGHCLLDGFAALRISRQGQSPHGVPYVVATV
jgi:hypothetical protein